uniref:Transcription initiation factor TFIID subunit 5 n=1 Tax=Lygus hesperus TaxID=30085 RepID=A0A0A9X4T2_LYGHE
MHLDTTKILWKVSGTVSYSIVLLSQEIISSIRKLLHPSCTSIRPFINHGTAHTRTISSIAFTNDGQFICTGSLDSTVKLWYTYPPTHPGRFSNFTKRPTYKPHTSILTFSAYCQLLEDQLLCTYYTKHTPVYQVHVTPRNLIFASGVYQNPHKQQLPQGE